ncbi:MAG: ferrochelatase [Thermodesulfovibrionales bacterium]|nr:ferrochelatase [Thermodesulfovibrionales bacterium]
MIGVILLNMGGPDSLESVKPFLQNLFSDRDIIKLGPSFLQKPLASLIIKTKLKKSINSYNLIGGKSPLLDITFQQAKALEDKLNSVELSSSTKFKVYVVMRYWHPFAMETINQIQREGIRNIIAISLYPHYSKATSGSSLKNLSESFSNITAKNIMLPQETEKPFFIDYSTFKVCFIPSWCEHPIYIDSIIEKIQDKFSLFRTTYNIPHPESQVIVLFSAHNLPQKFIKQGDPYVVQTQKTIKEITKRIKLNWYLSYQSKTGPVKWLEPATEDTIVMLAKKGIKNLLIVPISFVSDHIETLYEIDMLYKEIADKHGLNLIRTDSLNISPKFIEALAEIVISNSKKWFTL